MTLTPLSGGPLSSTIFCRLLPYLNPLFVLYRFHLVSLASLPAAVGIFHKSSDSRTLRPLSIGCSLLAATFPRYTDNTFLLLCYGTFVSTFRIHIYISRMSCFVCIWTVALILSKSDPFHLLTRTGTLQRYTANVCTSVSPESSVGIATRYRLDGPGIESR